MLILIYLPINNFIILDETKKSKLQNHQYQDNFTKSYFKNICLNITGEGVFLKRSLPFFQKLVNIKFLSQKNDYALFAVNVTVSPLLKWIVNCLLLSVKLFIYEFLILTTLLPVPSITYSVSAKSLS